MTNDQTTQQAKEMAAIQHLLLNSKDIHLIIQPTQLFILISLVQLALRHPGIKPELKSIAKKLARRLQSTLMDATEGDERIERIIDKGFDPRYDSYSLNGQDLPARNKINLTELITQVVNQVAGGDERSHLYDFLDRTGNEAQVVEVDLGNCLQTD